MPYKLLWYVKSTRRRTEKTNECSTASVRSLARAETSVDLKAVSLGYDASADILFVIQDLLGLDRTERTRLGKVEINLLIAIFQYMPTDHSLL